MGAGVRGKDSESATTGQHADRDHGFGSCLRWCSPVLRLGLEYPIGGSARRIWHSYLHSSLTPEVDRQECTRFYCTVACGHTPMGSRLPGCKQPRPGPRLADLVGEPTGVIQLGFCLRPTPGRARWGFSSWVWRPESGTPKCVDRHGDACTHLSGPSQC